MAAEARSVIRPILHHYGLTTANLQAMSEWYATVLGMSVVFETSSALGKDAPVQVRAARVTNDGANRRIELIGTPQITRDPDRSAHTRLPHFAYEYASLDDLLDAFVRLKGEEILPLLAADRGPALSMYYLDPMATAWNSLPTALATGRSPMVCSILTDWALIAARAIPLIDIS